MKNLTNIEQIIEIANKEKQPIKILLKTSSKPTFLGWQKNKGEIIYSIGSLKQEIAHTSEQFKDRYSNYSKFFQGTDCSDELIKDLKQYLKPVLENFGNKNINYQIYELKD